MQEISTSSCMTLGTSTTFAAGYGDAGCGLDQWFLVTQKFVQVFAATTNGTFGSQTFTITSGTSNRNKRENSDSLRRKQACNENDIAKVMGDFNFLGWAYNCESSEAFSIKKLITRYL